MAGIDFKVSEHERLRREVDALRAERDSLRERLDRVTEDALFAEAMEKSSEAIVIYDADGCLVACNQNFRDLYGYSEDEARPGVHFAELGRIDVERGNVVIGDEYGGGEDYLRRKAEYRKQLKGSFIVHLKDGRWIKTNDRRMSGGGFVSVQVDITDIKKSEADLREAKEAAEAATRLKNEFLANISHDLRTPLNAIIGFSELILHETAGPVGNESYLGYVDDIHESGKLLLSIVNDLLDTTKLESGQMTLDRDSFDPQATTASVVAKFRPTTLRKKLQVTVDFADGFPEMLLGDERALVQILNNLISNACRHTDEGGTIAVSWGLDGPGAVSLLVADTGSGMSADMLAKVGEPFLGGSAYLAQRGERGTGLGLYICTKLVAAMGGTLKVASAPDEGTTVRMTWPVEAA